MSRAFVKEDAEVAPLVPQRAPLPEGVPNYVTRRGLELLRSELSALLTGLASVGQTDGAGSSASASARAKIHELEARLASAEPVDPAPDELGVVRFGLAVTVRGEDGAERTYRIVGVDEANASEGRIAFVAPLARALLGRPLGEVVTVRTPRGEDELEIVAISP